MEVWKDVVGYKGNYLVSDYGRIKSVKFNKEKILKPSDDSKGYHKVTLYKNCNPKTFRVHSLVAFAFLKHKPQGMKLVINHIDLNKKNNKIDNLEIVSQRKNTNLKHIKHSSIYTGVSFNKRLGKWRAMIGINGKNKHIGVYKTELEAYNAYKNKLTSLSELSS